MTVFIARDGVMGHVVTDDAQLALLRDHGAKFVICHMHGDGITTEPVAGDAPSVELVGRVLDWIRETDSFVYYGQSDILTTARIMDAGSEEERVRKLYDSELLAPPYVTEPGYWDYCTGHLVLSDIDMLDGKYSHAGDDCLWFVGAVLKTETGVP